MSGATFCTVYTFMLCLRYIHSKSFSVPKHGSSVDRRLGWKSDRSKVYGLQNKNTNIQCTINQRFHHCDWPQSCSQNLKRTEIPVGGFRACPPPPPPWVEKIGTSPYILMLYCAEIPALDCIVFRFCPYITDKQFLTLFLKSMKEVSETYSFLFLKWFW